MNESELSIIDVSKTLSHALLKKEQTVSQNSLFCNDLFKKMC